VADWTHRGDVANPHEEQSNTVTIVDDQSQAPSDAGGGSKRGSLHPVLAVIPDECYERPTWKGLAYVGRDLVFYAIAVGLLLAFSNPLIVIPLWVFAALAISALFIVGHDAAHNALFESKRMNAVIGRVAMIPSWHVFEGWVLGHNRLHHTYTARQGFDFVWHPVTPQEFAELPAWKRWRHRLDWSWLGAGTYYVREIWWNKMIVGKPPKRFVVPIRKDRIMVATIVLAVSAGLAWLGWTWTGSIAGAAWLVARVWVVPFLAFCFVVGSLVHVHHIGPDLRWWPRRQWTKFAGQVEATTILHAPRGLDVFLHWIMIHIPHHVDVRIPMYHLPRAGEAIVAEFPQAKHGRLRLRDFVANTRKCKLYDFDTGTWYTYAEGSRQVTAAPAADAEPSVV
jgi:omega-6 fatty acid desaturase (delta-12 desaturase)